MLAWRAWTGQELRVDMVPDRERRMTVGAAPRQPGLLTGQRRFVLGRVGERPAWPVVRRECHRLFPEEMSAAPAAPPPSLPSTPACRTLAKHGARISSPSPASSSPKDLGHHHRRRDLNAHARRTTDSRRLPTCTADLRVSAPGAHAIERARDRIPSAAAHRAVITITANHPFWVMPGWCAQRPGAATWLVRIVRVDW